MHLLLVAVVRYGIGNPCRMGLDTGTAVSIIPASLYNQGLSQISLEKTSMLLKTYIREKVTPKRGTPGNCSTTS